MLERIFKDIKSSRETPTRFLLENEESYIYKGFKIIHYIESNTFKIFDCRYSDFYKSPKPKDLELIINHGFIKGCDLIMIERDKQRVTKYERIITRLFESIKNCQNTVRKRNIQNQLNEATDLFFFYKTRLNQLNLKYEIKSSKT